MNKITIRDVADKAGVSISTVHQALNGKKGVGEETRKRIQAVADELGVEFIDLNAEPYKVDINWDEETLDGGDHLNLSGAQKTTAFVGDWLTSAFELEDHRGDASYQRWQDLYESYRTKLEDLG